MTAVRGPGSARDSSPDRGRATEGREPAPDRDAATEAGQRSLRPIAVPTAGLAAIAVLTPVHAVWAVQLLLVPLLLVIPGMILLRALRIPGATVAACPVYLPAASILVLTVAGLATDLIGPAAGIAAPLRAVPLLIALEVLCAGLLLSGWKAPPQTQIPWGALERPAGLAWPLVLPLVAAAGALRLNTGHGAAVAEIAVVLAVAALVVMFLRAPWYDDALLMVVVFAVGLALMWSFSLRGDSVYGFDISSEYYAFMQTTSTGVWHLSHRGDAYGAMLSLTVLPTEFHELSGVQTLLVFKVVYPVIGALFPVGVFSMARRLVAGRWAFLAAILILMQQTFFQQLPALARQEVATLLFTALIALLLDTTRSRRRPGEWVFVCLLCLGMVVSHYSTTYLAIPLLGMAAAFQWILSWFKRIPRVTGVVLLAFAVSAAGAGVWYDALTHSASNVSQFVQAANAKGVSLLPNTGGNLLSTYLQGEATPDVSAAQYQSYISSYYKKHYPFIRPLPDATDAQYDLKTPPSTTPKVSVPAAASALGLIELLVAQLTNIVAGIAALILVFRRKIQAAAISIGSVSLVGLVLLMLVRISGTVAQAYNPQRAFLQLLIILAVAIAWLIQRIGAKYKWSRPWILAACSAAFSVYLFGTTGLSGAVLGGGTAGNLADKYTDYQRFVVDALDVAGGEWVLSEAPPGQVIETDRYGELRLKALSGPRQGIFGEIIPETTDRYAWVYGTSVNLTDNIVQSQTGKYAASYEFPALFLNQNFNVVYTNGTSEVFHR
jgi:uncharacterized membrane protein